MMKAKREVALLAAVSLLACAVAFPAAMRWREYSQRAAMMSDAPQSERPLRVPSSKQFGQALPNSARSILEKSQSFVFLSLDWLGPDYDAPPTLTASMFHGYRVEGQTNLLAEQRAELLASFYDGLVPPRSNNGLQQIAMCFKPRHGIRAQDGASTIDLLICFECLQFKLFRNGKLVGQSAITKAPQPTFNRILKQARVPLALR